MTTLALKYLEDISGFVKFISYYDVMNLNIYICFFSYENIANPKEQELSFFVELNCSPENIVNWYEVCTSLIIFHCTK